MFKNWPQLLIILFIIANGILIYRYKNGDSFSEFDLYGPKHKSKITQEKPTKISDFTKGQTSRFAILITDQQSKWQDLVKGFQSFGIPFNLTTDYKEAFAHKIVFIYPLISGLSLPPEGLRGLADYVRSGGTVIATNVVGGGLEDVFGFKSLNLGQKFKSISFQAPFKKILPLDHENEQSINLSNKKNESAMISNSYLSPKLLPLAVFNNNEAAIIQNDYGKGQAFALGIDLGQLFYLGYSFRDENMARSFNNRYEPTIDLFLRFFKEMYFKKNKDTVTLKTVPYGKKLSAIISHDIDFSESISNSLDYAKLEKENGISATYFLQVKYLKDFNDKLFFNQEDINKMRTIYSMGMEIGSHSISHSLNFAEFPFGNGTEVYPEYRPRVLQKKYTEDGTIMGELRVSKFLIEKKITKMPVVSFRPGHLANPFTLPEALDSSGYLFSSAVTANKSLTHLPFQLSYSRSFNSHINIFEFPITVEDEEFKDMTEQIPMTLELADQLSEYGGMMMILIHPNVTSHKLKFEKAIIDGIKDRAHFDNLQNFATWWTCRQQVQIDTTKDAVFIKSPQKISGLTLEIPKNKKIISTEPKVDFVVQGNDIVLNEFQGDLKLNWK